MERDLSEEDARAREQVAAVMSQTADFQAELIRRHMGEEAEAPAEEPPPQGEAD